MVAEIPAIPSMSQEGKEMMGEGQKEYPTLFPEVPPIGLPDLANKNTNMLHRTYLY